jgi:hypothetical protein
MNVLERECGNKVRMVLLLIGQVFESLKRGSGVCSEIDNIVDKLPPLKVGINSWYPLIHRIEEEVNIYCHINEDEVQTVGGDPKEGECIQKKEVIIKMLDIIPKLFKYSISRKSSPINQMFLYNSTKNHDIDISLASLRVIYRIYSGFENIGPPLLYEEHLFYDEDLSSLTNLGRKWDIVECIKNSGKKDDDNGERLLERALLLNWILGRFLHKKGYIFDRGEFLYEDRNGVKNVIPQVNQEDIADLLGDESFSLRIQSLIFMNLAQSFGTRHSSENRFKYYSNRLIKFSNLVVKNENITQEEFRGYMGVYLYFIGSLPRYDMVRSSNDKMCSCTPLIDHLFRLVRHFITRENEDSAGQYGCGFWEKDMLWLYHRYVKYTIPILYEKNPNLEIKVMEEREILNRCLYLINDRKGVIDKDHVSILYGIFKIIHIDHITAPGCSVEDSAVRKNIELLNIILTNAISSRESSILTMFLMEGVIDIMKIYTKKRIFEGLGLRAHDYILKLYEALSDAMEDVLLHSVSTPLLLELTKLFTITPPLKDGESRDEIFDKFPYDRMISDIITITSSNRLGIEAGKYIKEMIIFISRENQIFSKNISTSLQKHIRILINTEYDCGSSLNPRLYYDTSAHLLDLFFNCRLNQALMNMLDLASNLFSDKFNEFFKGLKYENIAKMICNPVLTTGIFHTKTTCAINIIKYLNFDQKIVTILFYEELFFLLEKALDRIDECGGEHMAMLRPYIKRGGVDNNIIIITQEVGGVIRIFRFMIFLLLNGSGKLKISFLNCIFQNGGYFGILEHARRIFYDANILLVEKSRESWAFAYQLARCGYLAHFKNENSIPVDLVGQAFIRGYTFLSRLHLEILSYSSSVSGENVDKVEEFKRRFHKEIKSGINKYLNHEQKYMEICILFLSFLDYVDDESIFKDILELLGDKLLEDLKRKLTSENPNEDPRSICEWGEDRSIRRIYLRLVNKALRLRNTRPNVGARRVEYSQP